MTFFNKKEDVIRIELTPYGRSLLSKGRLKPAYYAFFDDDILYDSSKGGFVENNTEIKNRILTETPSLRPFSTTKGVETNLNNFNLYEKKEHMVYPIGSSLHSEKKSPAWSINMLHNEIASSSRVLSSSLDPKVTNNNSAGKAGLLNIPQINCELEYTMSLANANDPSKFDEAQISNQTHISPGNNFVNVESEQILMYLLEKNGFINKDSFDIEVYLFEEDENEYNQLNFLHRPEAVKNDILVRGDLIELNYDNLTPEDVEYYFDLSLDNEVPDEDLCSGIANLKSNNIYLDLELKCPDRLGRFVDIYGSTLEQAEDCD